ncbi:hypothetical protein DS906_11715 [Ruegeria sp. A3M17]|nr:hypothetical protein DS906_11715 [Ruegeria sp. A3M17]
MGIARAIFPQVGRLAVQRTAMTVHGFPFGSDTDNEVEETAKLILANALGLGRLASIKTNLKSTG